MKSLARRVMKLEARVPAIRGGDELRREIRAMSPEERDNLRRFLEYARNGDTLGSSDFNQMKAAAEAAILNARGRL